MDNLLRKRRELLGGRLLHN